MNLLFDIGHPAHVHLFKNIIKQLKDNGHTILITIKDDHSIKKLLDAYQLQYIVLGSKGKGIFQKAFKQIYFTFSVLNLFWKRKIDIAMGVSISIAQASVFSRTKAIVFDDDDISATPVFAALSHSFANCIVSPDVLKKERDRRKDVFHAGYHELAYLHPNIFSSNKEILNELNINGNEFFSIIRFSALKAHHDINEKGISQGQAIQIIELLEKKGKVFITSEKMLPAVFQKYQLTLALEKFHDLLAYASIVVCDSQTVASEAAVLGVPSVRINTFVGRISYLEELEHKYRLTFGFKPDQFSRAFDKIQAIINSKESKNTFQSRRQKMLSEKIDLSAFMFWFLESYPDSKKIMKENPVETQKQFL